MIDLSIIIPGIRTDKWANLYKTCKESCTSHSFEMVFVSPYDLPPELSEYDNIVHIKDFGAPTRCVQIGANKSSGKLMTWGSDDGIFVKHSISKAIDSFLAKDGQKHEMIMRYTEGVGCPAFTPAHSDNRYWTVKYHKLHKKIPSVKPFWSAPLGMLYLDFFKHLGGFDCRFEHINLSCVDLSFRIQLNGGSLVLSPDFIMNCDWNPNAADYKPVLDCYHANDLPLLISKYSKIESVPVVIDFDNWKHSPEKWRRFR